MSTIAHPHSSLLAGPAQILRARVDGKSSGVNSLLQELVNRRPRPTYQTCRVIVSTPTRPVPQPTPESHQTYDNPDRYDYHGCSRRATLKRHGRPSKEARNGYDECGPTQEAPTFAQQSCLRTKDPPRQHPGTEPAPPRIIADL